MVDRGIEDFVGEGDWGTVLVCILTISGVKDTCLTILFESWPLGVDGRAGNCLLNSGLLDTDFLAPGPVVGKLDGFLALALGYLSIDLSRSTLPGDLINDLGSDCGTPINLTGPD
jgi:hypothetical protein